MTLPNHNRNLKIKQTRRNSCLHQSEVINSQTDKYSTFREKHSARGIPTPRAQISWGEERNILITHDGKEHAAFKIRPGVAAGQTDFPTKVFPDKLRYTVDYYNWNFC